MWILMPPKMNKIACISVCDIHIIHLIKIEIIQSAFKIFVKPVLEIAVAQKTKNRYQTFEGVVDPNCPPVHCPLHSTATPIFCPFLSQLF